MQGASRFARVRRLRPVATHLGLVCCSMHGYKQTQTHVCTHISYIGEYIYIGGIRSIRRLGLESGKVRDKVRDKMWDNVLDGFRISDRISGQTLGQNTREMLRNHKPLSDFRTSLDEPPWLWTSKAYPPTSILNER